MFSFSLSLSPIFSSSYLLSRLSPLQVSCSEEGVVSVADLKRLAHHCGVGVTLNDAVLAALSVSLQRHTQESHRAVATAIPVNLRLSTDTAFTLSNVFGSLSFFLPLNASFRLAVSGKSCLRSPLLIASLSHPLLGGHCQGLFLVPLSLLTSQQALPEPHLGFALMSVTHAVMPKVLARPFFDFFASKVKLSVSNVSQWGPRPVHFFNSLCTCMIGLVPPPNGCPIGVGVISYGDKVYFSVATDEGFMKNPRDLLLALEKELKMQIKQMDLGH